MMAVVTIVMLTFVLNTSAHRGQLDADGGHFDELTGLYHFQTEDGLYEQNPEEAPASTLVGPWVFTVIPEVGTWHDARDATREDTLAAYTDGALTETALATGGINPSVHKGHGWRMDWEIGFLKEVNPVCSHNIPEIAGHLATYHGQSYFYGVMRFTAERAAKTTIHLQYHAVARGWLNGVEFFSPQIQWRHGDPENPTPRHPQGMVREGDNILVVKIRRGGNNCGCYPNWFVTCGLKPHTPTRITIPFVLEDGEVIVDYFPDDTDIHDINGDGVVNILDLVAIANAINPAAPRLQRQKRQKLKPWATFKRR